MSADIVLVTRVRTLNKGNQALSVAWMRMLRRAYPGASVHVVERCPPHLLQFTIEDLAASRDPVARFEEIATRLASLPSAEQYAETGSEIVLDETFSAPIRLRKIRQRLNLRGRLAGIGRYEDLYRQRLAIFRRASAVVINPAGEFSPRSPQAAFYYLLDAYVAHKLGRPTCMVNHSLEIEDDVIRALVPHVYQRLALVGFRDDESVREFRNMGGSMHNVLVTPDLVITLGSMCTRPHRPGVVGLAVNVPEARAGGYLQRWREVLRTLTAHGFAVELLSNEYPNDVGFYRGLIEQCPTVRIMGGGLDFDAYRQLLATYELVITSRMHTAVLAMTAGTPVVPVEGASFKITGLFRQLGITIPTIAPTSPAIAETIVRRSQELRAERDAHVSELRQRIEMARARIDSDLIPRLRSLVDPLARADVA